MVGFAPTTPPVFRSATAFRTPACNRRRSLIRPAPQLLTTSLTRHIVYPHLEHSGIGAYVLVTCQSKFGLRRPITVKTQVLSEKSNWEDIASLGHRTGFSLFLSPLQETQKVNANISENNKYFIIKLSSANPYCLVLYHTSR